MEEPQFNLIVDLVHEYGRPTKDTDRLHLRIDSKGGHTMGALQTADGLPRKAKIEAAGGTVA